MCRRVTAHNVQEGHGPQCAGGSRPKSCSSLFILFKAITEDDCPPSFSFISEGSGFGSRSSTAEAIVSRRTRTNKVQTLVFKPRADTEESSKENAQNCETKGKPVY
ncbi:hypothetical protein ACOMHN_020868 [Nucella lapillus]